MVVINQNKLFGPFPLTYQDFTTYEEQEIIAGIIREVPGAEMKPFYRLSEREICTAHKAFVLKIMKLDPRDRPTAQELLQDEWFTERSSRTVGWFSKEEWRRLQDTRGMEST